MVDGADDGSPKTGKSPSPKRMGGGFAGGGAANSPNGGANSALKKVAVDMVNLATDLETGVDVHADGCLAVEMWYWNTRNEFKSEIMFCNPIDSDTPKLIIPLDVFEKMKKIYNEKQRMLAFKTDQFEELMHVFRTMRRQYYLELQSLRDTLKLAKEAQEARENGGYPDARKKAKSERQEATILNTEVKYFNILDAIDPEFKEVLMAECREFHRGLILENASLKDQLASLGLGDASLKDKLQHFLENYDVQELLDVILAGRPGTDAPDAHRQAYYKMMLSRCDVPEHLQDQCVDQYMFGNLEEGDITNSPEFRQLKEKFEQITEKYEDLQNSLESQRTRFEEEMEDKTAQLIEVSNERDRLETELNDLSMKFTDLSDQAATTAADQSASAALDSELAEARAKIEELERELNSKNDEIEKVRQDIVAEAEEKLKEAESKLSELEKSGGGSGGAGGRNSIINGSGEGGTSAELEEMRSEYPDLALSWLRENMGKVNDLQGQVDILKEELERFQNEERELQNLGGDLAGVVGNMVSNMDNVAGTIGVLHPDSVGGEGSGSAALKMIKQQSEFQPGDIVKFKEDVEVNGNKFVTDTLGIVLAINADGGEVVVKCAMPDGSIVSESVGIASLTIMYKRGQYDPDMPGLEALASSIKQWQSTAMAIPEDGEVNHGSESMAMGRVSSIKGYDSKTGRSAESLRDEVEQRRKERAQMMSATERLKGEIKKMSKANEDMQKKFVALEEAHKRLLIRQEAAFDEDLLSHCENDTYVFCLWMLRRFGTIREGINALDRDGTGSLGLGELIDGMVEHKFINFFARRVLQQFDLDGSGDIDADEIIEGKEKWALEENKRAMISKAEVDTMKDGWERKEQQLKDAYRAAVEEKRKLEEDLKKAKLKQSDGPRADPAQAKMNARMQKEVEKINRKCQMLEDELSSLKVEYEKMSDKAGRSMWQLRQDHAEVVRMKRLHLEKDIEIKKCHIKLETQKRLVEARKFIDELNLDDDQAQQEMESLSGIQKIADLLKTEEENLREVSTATLLTKLEHKDVPYRIRTEIKNGTRRWQMLYADACHRHRLDEKGTYRTSSPSPSYNPDGKIDAISPLVQELRDQMMQVPHGSWSYDFRTTSPRGENKGLDQGLNQPGAFQPSRVINMINFSPESRNTSGSLIPGGHFPPSKTAPLGFGASRNQTQYTNFNQSTRNNKRGRSSRNFNKIGLDSRASKTQSLSPRPNGGWELTATIKQRSVDLDGNYSQFPSPNSPHSKSLDDARFMEGERRYDDAFLPGGSGVPITITRSNDGMSPSVKPLTPRPLKFNMIPGEDPDDDEQNLTEIQATLQLPPPVRSAPGPQQQPLSDGAVRTVLKNFGNQSPRRMRDGPLQISSEDPLVLYNRSGPKITHVSTAARDASGNSRSGRIRSASRDPSTPSPRTARSQQGSPRFNNRPKIPLITMSSMQRNEKTGVTKVNLEASQLFASDGGVRSPNGGTAGFKQKNRSLSPRGGSLERNKSTSANNNNDLNGGKSVDMALEEYKKMQAKQQQQAQNQSQILKGGSSQNLGSSSNDTTNNKDNIPRAVSQVELKFGSENDGLMGSIGHNSSLDLQTGGGGGAKGNSPLKKVRPAHMQQSLASHHQQQRGPQLMMGGKLELIPVARSLSPGPEGHSLSREELSPIHNKQNHPIGGNTNSGAAKVTPAQMAQLQQQKLIQSQNPSQLSQLAHNVNNIGINRSLVGPNSTNSIVNISPDDATLPFSAQNPVPVGAHSGAGGLQAHKLQKSPSMYRVPGGRYIPRKDNNQKLDALHTNMMSQGPSGHSMLNQNQIQGGFNNNSILPFDPKDPPGRNALPSSHHNEIGGVHPLRRSQQVGNRKNSKESKLPYSPFKSVDDWANDT